MNINKFWNMRLRNIYNSYSGILYLGYDLCWTIFHYFVVQLLNLVDIFYWLYLYLFMCVLNHKYHISLTKNCEWEKVSIVGVIVNIFNIWFLLKKRDEIDFAKSFSNLLILLAAFDLFYLINSMSLFGLPAVSTKYSTSIYPYILPMW